MNKKGDTSQVFIYAITAVVAVMILLFGYKALGTIFNTQDQTANLQFKDDIKNMVDKSSTFGKLDIKEFVVPNKYTTLCFLEQDKFNPESQDNGIKYFLEDFPLAEELEGATDNAFLGDIDGNIDPFEVDEFQLAGTPQYEGENSPGVLCFKSSDSRIEIKFEGMGSKTRISMP